MKKAMQWKSVTNENSSSSLYTIYLDFHTFTEKKRIKSASAMTGKD